MTYVDTPHFYLEENVTAGLESPPANFVQLLIFGEKLSDAATTLLGVAVVSVKLSFLFFFRALLRQQKKMMIWWWCIFAILIPTAFIMIFAIFLVCAHWDQEIFGQSIFLLLVEVNLRSFTDALASQMRDTSRSFAAKWGAQIHHHPRHSFGRFP